MAKTRVEVGMITVLIRGQIVLLLKRKEIKNVVKIKQEKEGVNFLF